MADESSRRPLRIAGTTRGPAISLIVDAQPVQAFLGETVATALLANGRRFLRASPCSRLPRGMFCAMGICQECVVEIDGRLRTACTAQARDGMHVTTARLWDDV
jgi:D-hydroxyproline dehydrogenase subunit gamma